jgi:hypothetical protein
VTSNDLPLGIRGEDCYRSVPEADILRGLLLLGWAFEIGTGKAEEATKTTLQDLTELGLPFRRASDGNRLFDPIEVYNFMKWAGFDGRDRFLSERVSPAHRRMVTDSAEFCASQGRGNGECRFVVEFRRTFNLRSVAADTKLRLRAPLPLTGDYLKSMQVTPFADTFDESQIKLRPGRMEASIVANGETEATFGAILDVTLNLQEPRPGQGGGDVDLALYLNEREGLIVVTDRIRAFARSLAKMDAPVLDAVHAIWEYMNGKMIFGAIHYDQIDLASPCDWTLDTGWYDCQTAAALFVALCRARGIPARIIGGYLIFRVAPMKHYWAEAWIEGQGWTPFDFMSWDLSVGGRDAQWRDRYFGRVDYRLVCERMPREFTGALGLPLPDAWYMFQSAWNGGVENRFMNINGTSLYSDTVRVVG